MTSITNELVSGKPGFNKYEMFPAQTENTIIGSYDSYPQ